VDPLFPRDARRGARVGDEDDVPVPLEHRDGDRRIEGPLGEALHYFREVAPRSEKKDARRPREIGKSE
jgi:hypothetical protein